MIGHVKKFDLLLVRICERFSHWTQRWFGLTNFWWAKIVIVIGMSMVVASIFFAWPEASNDVIKNIGIGFFFCLYFCEFVQIFKLEKKVCSNLKFQNYAKQAGFLNRLVMQLVFFLGPIGLRGADALIAGHLGLASLSASWICRIVSFYFASCTPLPPSESKVKKWIRKGVENVAEIFAPEPIPIPVPVKMARW
ncbi:hypothetical protein ACFL2R_00385 [Patescibacteria group bacterium]